MQEKTYGINFEATTKNFISYIYIYKLYNKVDKSVSNYLTS